MNQPHTLSILEVRVIDLEILCFFSKMHSVNLRIFVAINFLRFADGMSFCSDKLSRLSSMFHKL